MTSDPGDLADQPERWPVSASVHRFTGHVVSLRTDTVQMPDGAIADRDVVVHPGAVGVIALDEQGRVLVLRQYRHPPGYQLWEPPAGVLDVPGENPLHTAQRELYEEAHCRAADWRVLIDMMTSPGMTDEAIRIYLARGLTDVPLAERHVGEHEEADMPIVWAPVEDLVRRILAGDLHNPILVGGVLALHAVLNAKPSGDGGPGPGLGRGLGRGLDRGLDLLRPADAPWPQRPYGSDPTAPSFG